MSYATYSVPCPYCNAGAGYPCRTSTGRVADPHKARRVEGFAALDITPRPVYPASPDADAAEEDTAVVVEAEDTVAPGDQADTAVEDDDRCSTCEQAAIIDAAATKARRAHAAADRGRRTLDPDAIVLDTVQHHDGRVSLAAFDYHDGLTIESRVVDGRVIDARLYDHDDQLRVTFHRASDFDALNDALNAAGVYEDDAPVVQHADSDGDDLALAVAVGVYEDDGGVCEDDAPSIGFGGPVHRRAPRAVSPNDVVQAIEAISGLNDTLIDPTVTGKYNPAGVYGRTAADVALDALVDDIEEAAVVEGDGDGPGYARGKVWAVRTVKAYNADFGPARATVLTALAAKFAEVDREDDDTGYEHGKVDGYGLALNVLDGYIG